MKNLLFSFAFLALLAVSAVAQSNPPQTWTEPDGSPKVTNPTTIKVTNGTLSCSGKVCTLTISGGGGGSPGGSNTQVQWNNAGAFGGISGLTTDGTNVTAGSANLRATRPRFTTSIDDSSGNEIFVFTATGSAVNEITIANAATGNNPTFTASGGDANVGINFVPKGSGAIQVSGSEIATAAKTLAFFSATTSAQLAGVVSDETGTGALVFANSPTFTTPNLGTPSAVTLTNGTGLPISTGVSGLGTGVATFLGTPSSANFAAAITDETGSGAVVLATSPTLTTPDLGTPSAAVLTNATGLPLSTGVTGDLPFANFVQAGSAGFVGATGAGDYSHRTPTQVTAALDAFVGDSGSGGTKGLVPAPSAGDSGKYLKGDGTWGTVSGGGLTVGTTAIASGTAGRILYETSGNVLGEIAGSSVDADGAVQFAANARSSGVAQYFRINTPADTARTASTESVGIYFGGNGSGSTVTRQWSTGALTTQRENVFVAPTYSFVGASTLTTAATVSITGAPVAGTNATLSRPFALDVSTGYTTATAARFTGVSSQSTSVPIFRVDSNASIGTNFPVLAVFGDGATANGGPKVFFGSTTGSGNYYVNVDYGAFAIYSAAVGASGTFAMSTEPNYTRIGSSTVYTAQLNAVSQSTTRPGIRVDSAANSTVDLAQFNLNADDTNSVANLATLAANSNGTAAAGFGQSITYTLESSTTNDQTAATEKVFWQTAAHASRGSAYAISTVSNAATSERYVIAPRKTLTDASAVSLFDAACASNTACGGTIEATIIATDGTDYQTRSVILTYQAVNKAGTLTSSITAASETAAVSTGTLTGTWTVLDGSGKITIQLNADSSLTTTAFYVIYHVKNNSEQAITIL